MSHSLLRARSLAAAAGSKGTRTKTPLAVAVVLVLLGTTALVNLPSAITAGAALPARTLRVMPLGDSITQGDASHPSYRRELWHQLQTGSFDVDFVGTQSAGATGTNPYTDFDLDHEGHSGWRADELAAKVGAWATAAAPDIVMLHAGTNDALQGQDAASTVGDLRQIITAARSVNPDVVVLLAQIIPANRDASVTATINWDQCCDP